MEVNSTKWLRCCLVTLSATLHLAGAVSELGNSLQKLDKDSKKTLNQQALGLETDRLLDENQEFIFRMDIFDQNKGLNHHQANYFDQNQEVFDYQVNTFDQNQEVLDETYTKSLLIDSDLMPFSENESDKFIDKQSEFNEINSHIDMSLKTGSLHSFRNEIRKEDELQNLQILRLLKHSEHSKKKRSTTSVGDVAARDVDNFRTFADGVPLSSLSPLSPLASLPRPSSPARASRQRALPSVTSARSPASCGRARFGIQASRTSGGTAKILNGKEALPGAFPWQVVVMTTPLKFHCGGTLIAPRWVLTAGHCVRKRLWVQLYNDHMSRKDPRQMRLKVQRIFRHPNFNLSSFHNDVALLRLPAIPAEDHDSVEAPGRPETTVCLPKGPQDFPPVGSRCLVMGWGKEQEHHQTGSDGLMYAALHIIAQKSCLDSHYRAIASNMFCAGHYKGGADTCTGDSGGPLICSLGTAPGQETWTIYGVTSFGVGCGRQGEFGVYSRVNMHLQWIESVTGRYGD